MKKTLVNLFTMNMLKMRRKLTCYLYMVKILLFCRFYLLLRRWNKKIGEGTSYFAPKVTCGGKVFDVIIDNGSIENIVSKEVGEKLKLATEKRPQPYKILWIWKDNEIRVTSRCLVQFNIGNVYKEVWCDILPMNACHILLGHSYLFDCDMEHNTKPQVPVVTKLFSKTNKINTIETYLA